MFTKGGLRIALNSLIDKDLTVGLYVNDLDGEDVRLSDVVQPKNYSEIIVPKDAWKLDAEALHATAARQSFRFLGKAGKVIGYYIASGDEVVCYEPFMDPLPINSNEDVVHVKPRIKARFG